MITGFANIESTRGVSAAMPERQRDRPRIVGKDNRAVAQNCQETVSGVMWL